MGGSLNEAVGGCRSRWPWFGGRRSRWLWFGVRRSRRPWFSGLVRVGCGSARPWFGGRRWRWLWFGKGCTKWVDTMVILTENALETEMGPGRRRQIKRNQQGPSRRRKRRRRKRSRTHHMLGYLFLHGCQDAHEGTHAFGR